MSVLLAFLGGGSAGMVMGCGLAFNARLQQFLRSPLAVTLTNFSMVFFILALLLGLGALGPFNPGLFLRSPWWAFLGGLAGSTYVTISTIVVMKIGVASSVIAIISGQIFTSVIIDQFGLLGASHHPVHVWRLLGIFFLFVAVVINQFSSKEQVKIAEK
jgi:Uncharacterized protein conserved in bacteria